MKKVILGACAVLSLSMASVVCANTAAIENSLRTSQEMPASVMKLAHRHHHHHGHHHRHHRHHCHDCHHHGHHHHGHHHRHHH